MKIAKTLALLLVVAALAYPGWLAYQVWSQSHADELHSADAIVVLGAAQYDGIPSPIFKARLDHAAYLYGEGFAGTVIVTGGKQRGDRYTEAETAERYLTEEADLPPGEILTETVGSTTLESLRRVRRLSAEAGLQTVLLVSDPLHSERIKRIATDLGFAHAYTSPASYLALERSRVTKAKELVREVASLLAYELLGR